MDVVDSSVAVASFSLKISPRLRLTTVAFFLQPHPRRFLLLDKIYLASSARVRRPPRIVVPPRSRALDSLQCSADHFQRTVNTG
jgi:hypothetical protein